MSEVPAPWCTRWLFSLQAILRKLHARRSSEGDREKLALI